MCSYWQSQIAHRDPRLLRAWNRVVCTRHCPLNRNICRLLKWCRVYEVFSTLRGPNVYIHYHHDVINSHSHLNRIDIHYFDFTHSLLLCGAPIIYRKVRKSRLYSQLCCWWLDCNSLSTYNASTGSIRARFRTVSWQTCHYLQWLYVVHNSLFPLSLLCRTCGMLGAGRYVYRISDDVLFWFGDCCLNLCTFCRNWSEWLGIKW